MAETKQYTDEELKDVERLAGLAFTHEQIADYIGISRRSFQTHIKDNEELAALYKKGRAKTNAGIAATIRDAGIKQGTEPTKTQLTAAIFYAKTQMRWSETQIIEHQGRVPVVVASEDDKETFESV